MAECYGWEECLEALLGTLDQVVLRVTTVILVY